MYALVGGQVQATVSKRSAFSLALSRPQPYQPGGEDLADLGEPLGGGHKVGVEGVGQGRDVVGEVRADVTSAGVSGVEDKRAGRIIAMMSDY